MKPSRVLSGAGGALLLYFAAAGCSNSKETEAARLEPVAKIASRVLSSNVTLAGDEQRTGWYPNQPRLSPAVVLGGAFGQLFSAKVTGQVYAQPLVIDDTLFVATETNDLYGLDPETGLVHWTRNLGGPWNPQDIGCSDLLPTVGVTGTPVIDSTTNTAYLLSKVYATGTSGAAMWLAHAVDLSTGAERPNFPVQVQGTASNDPTRTFDATHESQRPGLLLMDGVVYAAFAAHCDRGPWAGWVAGIGTEGAMRTLWITHAAGNGASGGGIWQSGGGLVSDGPGQILFSTGNGGAPKGPIAGNNPPKQLAEAIVRLSVQSDGSLKATDFFAPYDAQQLDGWDADLASGGLTALPTEVFGTGLYPRLMVQSGKQGYVYLLDLENLGGIGNGAAGADLVVNRLGPYGGVWSAPAVWPGDGGYVYIPTASGGNASAGSLGVLRGYHYGLDGNGKPTLSLVGTSKESFGFSSSHPIVTSDGTTSGSALLWIVWSPSGAGAGAQLRAYDPIPSATGDFTLRYSAPVGTAAKFTPPGVGAGRIYVGTRDGHVLGFGATVPAPLTAPPVEFGAVIVGQSASSNVVFTASDDVTITQIVPPSGDFTIGSPTPSLPAALHAGDSLSFGVTFSPASPGLKAASAEAVAQDGRASVTIAGRGRSPEAVLTATPPAVSFGATTIGGHAVGSVTFGNPGAAPLTINSVTLPVSPFILSGVPPIGRVLNSDESVTLTVEFAPTALGNYLGSVGVTTTAGNASVPLSGRCGQAGKLSISPLKLDFGPLALGARRDADFTLKNTGTTGISILKSKPPALGSFTAKTALDEGTPLESGTPLVETVSFAPTVAGDFVDGWTLTATDNQREQTVTTLGTGIAGKCAPDGSDFTLNGHATRADGELTLTSATETFAAGSSFCPNAVPSATLDVSFDFYEGDGSGGDGMTLVLANAALANPQALGGVGSALGFAGIPGVAVAFDTVSSPGDPSANFIGIARGPSSDGQTLAWVKTTSTIPILRGVPHRAHVFVATGSLVIELDGGEVLRQAMTLPELLMVGFSAGAGAFGDRHAVSNISLLDLALVPTSPPGQGGEGGAAAEGGASGGESTHGGTTSTGGRTAPSGGSSGNPASGGQAESAGAGGDSNATGGREERGGATSGGKGSTTGGNLNRGGNGLAGADSGEPPPKNADSGCSCRTAGSRTNAGAALPLLLAATLLRRRRRQTAAL
jgi:MYXO-CTERM domain-containing protein